MAVAGFTSSFDFPTTPGLMDTVHDDGLLAKSDFGPSGATVDTVSQALAIAD